jgi:nitroreductase
MRIDSCPVEGFIPAKYDEILGLTEKWLSSVVVLPIWYRDISDKYSELKKVRFPTSGILEMT